MKNTFLSLAITSAIASHALVLATEDNLVERIETITVNGDFSALALSELSQSASVIDASTLQTRQAFHSEDILSGIANVNLSSGASRARFIQIRGIGERSQFAEPINPSVGMMLDGLDISGLGALATIFDVAQVEVLRGPQATAHGANGLAGVVNFVSIAPSAEPQGYVRLGLAQDDTLLVAAAYSQGLSESLNARVAFQQYQSNGFVKNAYLQRDDTDDIKETNARLAFHYQSSTQQAFTLNLFHGYVNNGYDAFSLDNDNVSRADEPGHDRLKGEGITLSSMTDFDWGTLTLSGAALSSNSLYSYDEDWTYVGFHPWEYSSVDAYYRDRDNRSLAVIARSEQDLEQAHWTLGVQYKASDENLLREYTYADNDFTSRYDPETTALFGQYNYPLANNLLAEAGVRLERFTAEYHDNSGFSEQQSETLLGGKIGLSYRQPSLTYYGSISRGYKAGGFNPSEAVSNAQRTYDAEYNWNYELGVKYQTKQLSSRLAIFQMVRKNTQISDFAVVQGPDNSVQFIDIIDNADNGTNRGVELEVRWQPDSQIEFGADVGYLDAYFNGFTRADGTQVTKQQQAQSPRGSFHFFANLGLSETWQGYLVVEGKSSHRFSDGHDEINPAYVLTHLTLTKDVGPYTISFWGKNLFDTQYYTRGFGGFSNDPRDYYAQPEPYYQFGNGRRFGVNFNLEF